MQLSFALHKAAPQKFMHLTEQDGDKLMNEMFWRLDNDHVLRIAVVTTSVEAISLNVFYGDGF